MIPRDATATLRRLAQGFPLVALTGPRQSGKTTLARAVFGDKPYVSLEDPDERAFADADPRGFLRRFEDRGVVIDEAQRCPALFSYLQGWVDQRRIMGDVVLTGSQQFGLMTGISQSLAGRVGMVNLLPLAWAEVRSLDSAPATLEQALWRGGYPALYDRPVAPPDWFAAYVATYVERDVRQLIAVRDLSVFQRFVSMCAARCGQLLNLSSLATDCGITQPTAREWLSVLAASYIVVQLPPYHRNFGKRLVKTPKLYFLDVGLAAWLLGIRDAQALATHAMRGALFESWAASEYIKSRCNAGLSPALHFWRDHAGHEVDLVIEAEGGRLDAVELKSGSTYAADWADALKKWQGFAGDSAGQPMVVYGGDASYERQGVSVRGWRNWPDVTTR
ncbi:ATP-binding protein [Ideonella sp. BN130291]|uniref:ATP-binding protein n=1 Tax=Ideonella sp. BN130291 TaxID=3112940 RepID=UPI002E270DBB|nr:ATP-binding protein [Ideonella sp. BN130291]